MKKYILGIIAIFLTFGLGACSSQTQKSNHKANQKTANAKKVKSRKVALADNQTLLHLLKMDPISLKDEVKSGKSIVDIGKEKNVTEDQMVNALLDQRINSMKKSGKTNEEINQRKQKLTEQIKRQLERKNQKSQQAS
jgi:hypothetical protein